MSYSVYVPLTKKACRQVMEFVNDPELAVYFDSEDFETRPPSWDLPYATHKTYIGCNYGGSKPFCLAYAWTFCNWLAKKMGKPYFIYDGETKVPVIENTAVCSHPIPLLRRKAVRRLNKMVALLDRKWEELQPITK